jgi:RNA polymerase sigma-70 factor (ECF subfamily)
MSAPGNRTQTVDVAPSAALRGDEPPVDLSAFYRDYAGLRSLIIRRVGDPEAAADILQDAIVTTLQKLRDGEIDNPEFIGGYIYRVALNHLRNYRRKDKSELSDARDIEALADQANIPADMEVQRGQWAQAARNVLIGLPTSRDREILIRFYLDEEGKDSICSSLGLSEAHFIRVIFRARSRFKLLLERSGYHKADLLSLALWILCSALLTTQFLPGGPSAGPRSAFEQPRDVTPHRGMEMTDGQNGH